MTTETKSPAVDVRDQVAAAYTRAVSRSVSKERGCGCAPVAGAGSEAGERPGGAVTQTAGYAAAELADLPADAVASSFGCGNPVALSGIGRGDTVVDLGSGAGLDLLLAARRVGPSGRVIGVDMTDAMLERARRNIAASGLANVEVRKGLIEELPVASASVDWVISNCVINLSPEKSRVFAEIARVLKDGGRFSVSDIVVESLPEWARANAALYASCVAGAVPESEYLAGLRSAGLEAKVSERQVYDAEQVLAFLESEELGELPREAGGLERLAGLIKGKVWSARFVGRKP